MHRGLSVEAFENSPQPDLSFRSPRTHAYALNVGERTTTTSGRIDRGTENRPPYLPRVSRAMFVLPSAARIRGYGQRPASSTVAPIRGYDVRSATLPFVAFLGKPFALGVQRVSAFVLIAVVQHSKVSVNANFSERTTSGRSTATHSFRSITSASKTLAPIDIAVIAVELPVMNLGDHHRGILRRSSRQSAILS